MTAEISEAQTAKNRKKGAEQPFCKVAYMTPPQENWNEFRVPSQRNENFITEECYLAMKNAGFTHGLGLYEHGKDIALRALRVAEKTGMKYYVRDYVNWTGATEPEIWHLFKKDYLEYASYSSFAGVYVYDEPPVGLFARVERLVRGYRAVLGEKGEPLVNLLPVYANDVEQLGAPYEEYLRLYAETVSTDYILFDHYPFGADENGNNRFRRDYLYNLKAVAEVCKKYDKNLRTFIQSFSPARRKALLTYAEIALQVNCALAYGSRYFAYFHYWGSMESGGLGLVDCKGNPTSVYYAVQSVHENLKYIEEETKGFVWENSELIQGENAVFKIRASSDLVVGEFVNGSRKGYYLVNYSYDEQKENAVSIGSTGKWRCVKSDGREPFEGAGCAKISLKAGEAAFFAEIGK